MDYEALAAIVGPEGVTRSEVGRINLAPSEPRQLRDLVATAGRLGRKLNLLQATLGPFGRPDSARAGLAVDLSRMDRILEVDSANLVATIEAGVRHESLSAALAEAHLRWPVAAFGQQRTIAETISTGLGLVKSSIFPDLRHWMLGGRWMLGSGTSLASGGKTVKNSAGYDVSRILVGSFGYSAIPVECHLRLEPIAARQIAFEGGTEPGILSQARSGSTAVESIHVAALPGAGITTVISFAGRVDAVESAVTSMSGVLGNEVSELDWMNRVLGPLSDRAGGGLVRWTAGPDVCARIVAKIAESAPELAAFAAPLSRWGIAAGTDRRKLDEIVAGCRVSTSEWPADFDRLGEGGGGGLGFSHIRNAFDPDSVLV